MKRRGEGDTKEDKAKKQNSSHGLRRSKGAAVLVVVLVSDLNNLITKIMLKLMMYGVVSSSRNVGFCLWFKSLDIVFEDPKGKRDIFSCL